MLTLNDQRITVSRIDLINALKNSLSEHKISYSEALEDYKNSVEAYLEAALSRVSTGDFSDVVLKLTPPVNHEDQYVEILEMMEASTDETITLDKGSFNAYYRNVWPWTSQFSASAVAYKSALSAHLSS